MSKFENSNRKIYANQKNETLLGRLLQNLWVCLAIHWLFQGILYMDRTERLFKLSMDIIITISFGLFFQFLKLPAWIIWPLSFLLAHTINFVLNAQFWGLMKTHGLINVTYEQYEKYTNNLSLRIKNADYLLYGGIYGSLVRGEWKSGSDLDIRLVRQPGIENGIKACAFVLAERTRALFSKFPLDVYVLDSDKPLARMRKDELPLIVFEEARRYSRK